jgi:hypothetical protein
VRRRPVPSGKIHGRLSNIDGLGDSAACITFTAWRIDFNQAGEYCASVAPRDLAADGVGVVVLAACRISQSVAVRTERPLLERPMVWSLSPFTGAERLAFTGEASRRTWSGGPRAHVGLRAGQNHPCFASMAWYWSSNSFFMASKRQYTVEVILNHDNDTNGTELGDVLVPPHAINHRVKNNCRSEPSQYSDAAER